MVSINFLYYSYVRTFYTNSYDFRVLYFISFTLYNLEHIILISEFSCTFDLQNIHLTCCPKLNWVLNYYISKSEKHLGRDIRNKNWYFSYEAHLGEAVSQYQTSFTILKCIICNGEKISFIEDYIFSYSKWCILITQKIMFSCIANDVSMYHKWCRKSVSHN